MLRQAAWPWRLTGDAFAGATRDTPLQQAHDVFFRLESDTSTSHASILALLLKEVTSAG